jgi:hypothetical protein
VSPQANIDRTADVSEWKLDALAYKMTQYCPLLDGLSAEVLRDASNNVRACVCGCGGGWVGVESCLTQAG